MKFLKAIKQYWIAYQEARAEYIKKTNHSWY